MCLLVCWWCARFVVRFLSTVDVGVCLLCCFYVCWFCGCASIVLCLFLVVLFVRVLVRCVRLRGYYCCVFWFLCLNLLVF